MKKLLFKIALMVLLSLPIVTMAQRFYPSNFEELGYYSSKTETLKINDRYIKIAGFEQINDTIYQSENEETLIFHGNKLTSYSELIIDYYFPTTTDLTRFLKRLKETGYTFKKNDYQKKNDREETLHFQISKNVKYKSQLRNKIRFTVKEPNIDIPYLRPVTTDSYPFQNSVWFINSSGNEYIELSPNPEKNKDESRIEFLDDKNVIIVFNLDNCRQSFKGTYNPIPFIDQRNNLMDIRLEFPIIEPSFKIEQTTDLSERCQYFIDILTHKKGLKVHIYDDGLLLKREEMVPPLEPIGNGF